MALLDVMVDRLYHRIDEASHAFPQFIYFADVHYQKGGKNDGFDKVLSQIQKQEKTETLFVLIGGDMIDAGSEENYSAFIERCEQFYQDTTSPDKCGIPIIPTMGNHEFYGVKPKNTEIETYKGFMGDVNFPLDIPAEGLGDTLRIVAFNDAMPRKYKKIKMPDIGKGKNCATKVKDKHLFYFPDAYIHLSKTAPKKYSHFPEFLKTEANHIIVTSHVPPRKDPLLGMLDSFIENEYTACLKKNPVISLKKLKDYYRDLWMLVHGHSEATQNDSTQWFIDTLSTSSKVELVLMGHVHTYYPFTVPEIDKVQMVISGGGKGSKTYSSKYPVANHHYLRVKYDVTTNRFVYEKVDVL